MPNISVRQSTIVLAASLVVVACSTFEQVTKPLCRVNRQVADVWFATE